MPDPNIAERLATVRRRMSKEKLDILLVRSTDRFLNEYVPDDDSARVWISGFTGSMGDVVITKEEAFLAVDGRYWKQAEEETSPESYQVVKVPLGIAISTKVAELLGELVGKSGRKKPVIGYEHAKTTPAELDALQRAVGERGTWLGVFPSPVEAARGVVRSNGKVHIRALDEAKVGATVGDKLATLGERFAALEIDAMVVQKLDEIAYLSNLRGDELPYQATFKALGLATKETLFIGIDPSVVPRDVRVKRPSVMFVPEPELWSLIGPKTKRRRVGYDRNQNTELARQQIAATGAETVAVDSPILPMKAKKNAQEMAAMVAAFGKADRVVSAAAAWLSERVAAGKRVSEADFAEQVRALFLESGATGLSFKVISAAGKNGANIHYSTPNPKRLIKKGELMLLDTGAYYDEGYATDLTRTFLVDGPKAKGTEQQRRYFTVVLKAAIAGMTAVLPEGARGYQLDAITRAPLWAEGLDFNHGTGHGVGVNVHEFPPRIGPTASAPIEVGHVFSIEPGVYLPEFGGIRIENLCTVEPSRGRPGFIEVKPLTFSPLDDRLIEPKLLSPTEKAFLQTFSAAFGTTPKRKRR